MNARLLPSRAALSWLAQVIAATIFAQTLFFKFSGAEESIYIFQRLGAEPWGRFGSGVVELSAAVLLLTPRWSWIGAALGLVALAGALLAHLTVLGIEVRNDGGLLFGFACLAALCCAAALWLRREKWYRLAVEV